MKKFSALFVAIAFFALPNFVCADLDAKKKIFENCDEAKAAIAKLTSKEVDEFVSYLGRVICLPTGSVSELLREPELMALLPATPLQRTGQQALSDITGAGISHTLEPTREIEAKLCASKLLLEFSEKAVPLIPDLVQAAEEPTLSDEARQQLSRNVRLLIQLAATQRSPTLVGVVEKLFEQFLAKTNESRAELFSLFGDVAQEYVLGQLLKGDETRSTSAQAILLRMSSGVELSNILARVEGALIHSDGTQDDRIFAFVEKLPQFPMRFLGFFYRRSLMLDTEDAEGAVSGIERSFVEYEKSDAVFEVRDDFLGAFLGTLLAERIFQASQLSDSKSIVCFLSVGSWENVERKLFRDHFLGLRILSRALKAPSYQRVFRDFLSSLDDGFLGGLASLWVLLDPAEERAVHLCIDRMSYPQQSLQIEAYRCVGSSTVGGEEVEKAMLRRAKSVSSIGREEERQTNILLILDVLGRRPQSPLQRSFLPYALEALRWSATPEPFSEIHLGSGALHSRSPFGAEELLCRFISQITPQLRKMLTDNTFVNKTKLVQLLGNCTNIAENDRQALANLLKKLVIENSDVSFRSAVEDLLLSWERPPKL